MENLNVLQQSMNAYNNATIHEGSGRYTQLSSEQVTSTLERYGWKMNAVSQAKKSKITSKHIMVYESAGISCFEGIPRILVFNSHNKSCSLTLQFGFFRTVCANGLVVGKSLIEPVRLRHVGDIAGKLDEVIREFIAKIEIVLSSIDVMKNTPLSNSRVYDFMAEAVKLRKTKLVDQRELNHPTRTEDADNTVWAVMNRVQEKMVNGGAGFRKLQSDVSKAKVSSDLWELANRYCKAA